MAFRGTFVKNVTTNTNHPPRANWGVGSDARHADPSMKDDQGFPDLKTPHVPAVPEHVEDRYNPEGVNAAYLPPTDFEPKGHMGSGTPPRTSNRYDEIASDNARRSENRGSTLKHIASMVMRDISQTFSTMRTQSLPPSTDDASAGSTGEARRALRGNNSLAENNPGSPEVNYSGNYIRQGYEISRITDRRMPRRGLTHTQRPIYLNTAEVARVTGGPQGSNYSPYGSPYDSVGRLTSGVATPIQRRDPRPYAEDAITDGTEQTSYSYRSEYNAWGL